MEVCGEKGIGSGRHVRSRSRVTEGTLIWSEPALVTGPRWGQYYFVTTWWYLLQTLPCPRLCAVSPLSENIIAMFKVRITKYFVQIYVGIFNFIYRCGLSICDECSAKEMNGNIATTLRGLTPHSVECSFLTSHGVMLNRKRNKTEAKLLQPLVTILRLLLTDGWSELEGNVSKRKGSKSWNFTEKNIIPHLQNIRDLNHNNIFSKVWFGFYSCLKYFLLIFSGWYSPSCGNSWHKLFWSQMWQKSENCFKNDFLCRHIYFIGWSVHFSININVQQQLRAELCQKNWGLYSQDHCSKVLMIWNQW